MKCHVTLLVLGLRVFILSRIRYLVIYEVIAILLNFRIHWLTTSLISFLGVSTIYVLHSLLTLLLK